MHKIKFVTDSASDIPAHEAEAHGIEVLPIPITVDGKSYLEGVDFTPEQFYDILLSSKTIPTTSHITTPQFAERFAAYYDQGYGEVVLVTINSKGSNMRDAAVLGRQMFYDDVPEAAQRMPIHILDSGTYAYAYGAAVVRASAMAAEGAAVSEILEYLQAYFNSSEVLFSVYTLDFAKKSGRISCAAAFVGEVLGLRPVFTIIDGEIKIIEKVRGDKNIVPKMVKEVVQRIAEKGSDYQVLSAYSEEPANELAQSLTKELGYPPSGIYKIGASVTINSGPKVVGVALTGRKRR